MKEDSRVLGPWSDKLEKKVYIPTHMRDVVLNPLQVKMLELIEKDNAGRSINIFEDAGGNKGKSFLATYHSIHQNGIFVPLMYSDPQKIMEFIYAMTHETPHVRRTIWIDLPRAFDTTGWAKIVRMLEQLKSGQVCDLRYTARVSWIEQPRIVVFVNKLPDGWADMASKDRWKHYSVHLLEDQVRQEEADKARQAARGSPMKRRQAMGPIEMKAAMEEEKEPLFKKPKPIYIPETDDEESIDGTEEIPGTPQGVGGHRVYSSQELRDLAALSDFKMDDFEVDDDLFDY